MAFRAQRFDISTTATPLSIAPASVTGGPGKGATLLNTQPGGGVTFDLGGPDVVVGEGFPLRPGATVMVESIDADDVLHAVAPQLTVGGIAVLEGGV